MAYPGTSGLKAIDHAISDRYLDPPDAPDPYRSEETLRLQRSFWLYAEPEKSPDVGALPALTEGRITFGCLNNLCKTNPQVLGLFAKVLDAVPMSRLALLSGGRGASGRTGVLEWIESLGIPRDRIILFDRAPRDEYLKLYNAVDISLDPFPYGG